MLATLGALITLVLLLPGVAGALWVGPCGFVEVSAGEGHTCGIRNDGTVECWGWNRDGQSGAPAGTFSQVSAGVAHTCGLHTDGTVECWGDNFHSQSSPPAGTFLQVSAGAYHTCSLHTDRTVECWGGNFYRESSPPCGSVLTGERWRVAHLRPSHGRHRRVLGFKATAVVSRLQR